MKRKIKDFLLQFRLVRYLRSYIFRDKRFLEGITREQKGLEIGPSHHPVAPKREGYDVEIVDWLDQDGLKEHYKNDGINLDAIEPVDYVWKGGSYFDLIQKENHYDYIIASHMIEHSTDFLGFLRDCSRLLKKGGVVRLAVPDKRYCFDHYRCATGIAEVLNNYESPSDQQSVGYVGEYLLNASTRKKKISWNRPRFPLADLLRRSAVWDYWMLHPVDSVLEQMEKAKKGEYIDIHHYVFTPASFELLIYELRILKLTDLKIERMWNTQGNEFIVGLQKTEEQIGQDFRLRRKLLRKKSRQDRF